MAVDCCCCCRDKISEEAVSESEIEDYNKQTTTQFENLLKNKVNMFFMKLLAYFIIHFRKVI